MGGDPGSTPEQAGGSMEHTMDIDHRPATRDPAATVIRTAHRLPSTTHRGHTGLVPPGRTPDAPA